MSLISLYRLLMLPAISALMFVGRQRAGRAG
jgi:hypothetical protein